MEQKHKKTVVLVGHAPSSVGLVPWDNPEIDEFWGLNAAHCYPWMKRGDRYFQLHSMNYLQKLSGQSDLDRQHWKWLTEPHPFPIYMQKHFDECPASVEYPIKEVRKRFGDFYTSTFAYMAALAILEGFERIEAYGFEMASDTEYFYQRDSTEYFIGLILGMGIEFYLPENCSLLKGDVYAFEDNSTGFLQQLELRQRTLTIEKNKQLSLFYEHLGRITELTRLEGIYPDLKDKHQAVFDDYLKQRDTVQAANGAEEEVAETRKLYKSFFNTSGGVYFNGSKEQAEKHP